MANSEYKQAVKEATACMHLRMKQIAYDAHVWEQGTGNQRQKRAYEEYKRIVHAIEVLERAEQLKLL